MQGDEHAQLEEEDSFLMGMARAKKWIDLDWVEICAVEQCYLACADRSSARLQL